MIAKDFSFFPGWDWHEVVRDGEKGPGKVGPRDMCSNIGISGEGAPHSKKLINFEALCGLILREVKSIQAEWKWREALGDASMKTFGLNVTKS